MSQIALPLGVSPVLLNSLLVGSALVEIGAAVAACIGTYRKKEVFTVY